MFLKWIHDSRIRKLGTSQDLVNLLSREPAAAVAFLLFLSSTEGLG